MNAEKKETKKMLSHEKIYRIVQWLPPVISAVFFLKNVLLGNTAGMVSVGLCMVGFVSVLVFINVRKVSLYVKEYILAIALPLLVFMISLGSGDYYSDDFPMFLAVIALTGMFLEPEFTKTQIVLIDVLFAAMYYLHPEKADKLTQYIMCMAIFTLAACLIYQVIRRGRAFIEISQERAKESEELLKSIRQMGKELQQDFTASSMKIDGSTQGIQRGSVTIARNAGEVSKSCEQVKDCIRQTGEQVGQLNEEVMQFEAVLTENRANVDEMKEQVNTVSEMIGESGQVFRRMEERMHEIDGIAKKINDISFRLTILSLNAAVEAARAGNAGSGFEVLASEMRTLSETSSGFAGQVSEVLNELSASVLETSARFAESEVALEQSECAAMALVDSFERLRRQFGQLYENIECQNENVNGIERIFGELNHQVTDMYSSAAENQNAVEDIAEAMDAYRENIEKIVQNTQSV